MATFSLSACRAWRTQGRLSTSLIVSLTDRIDTRQSIEARNISEIHAAVAKFGKQIAADHVDASFSISVIIVRGGRKPNGFDSCYRSGQLGTELWVQMRDRDGNKLPDPVAVVPAASRAA